MAASREGTPEADSKYREILKNNGITEPVSEVIVKDSGLQGAGWVSDQLYITVKFENPKLPQLNLFGKVVARNATQTKMITEGKAFEKEARFFMEYIPLAEKLLCKGKGLQELLDIYPKCYYGDEKLILLENLLLAKGYSLESSEHKQGLDEAKCALLTLAKHHAISHAMIQKHGGAEGFFKTFKNFDFEFFKTPSAREMMKPIITNCVKNNRKILEKHPVKGGDVALEMLKTEGENAYEIFVNNLELDKDDNTLLVLCHGDYHGNNMMFLRDQKTQKILHHKAIDFQVVCHNSPALDLGYYLYTSVKPEVRRSHLKELFNFYLDHLNKVCFELGHPIEYSFEELFLQYRKKFKHGYWMGFITVGPPQSIYKDVDVSDIKDMNDLAERFDKAFLKAITGNPDQSEKIAREIVDFIEEYYELCLDN